MKEDIIKLIEERRSLYYNDMIRTAFAYADGDSNDVDYNQYKSLVEEYDILLRIINTAV